ncbi:MAG: hypothetical protein K2Y01_05895 [Rhabdochlamydiaceae bacterium]|nr:hypothetical protein [Rhabdochlamydiaceae bacterium]
MIRNIRDSLFLITSMIFTHSALEATWGIPLEFSSYPTASQPIIVADDAGNATASWITVTTDP